MKATANKAIIYDDTCPLCVWYTDAFVKTGLLKKDNRISFNELTKQKELTASMDMHRSKHEIPLVDLEGGKTLYGLESLSFILSQKIPFVKWCLQFAPIRAFFKGLYNIISYNRRVIVGAAKSENQTFDCTPDFHSVYRMVYIILAFIIGGIGAYALGMGLVYANGNPIVAYLNLIILYASVIAWGIYCATVIVTLFDKRKLIEYFGQLATIQLIGLGVYGFFTVIAAFFPISVIAPFLSTIAVVAGFGIMFREHYRRLEVINLPKWRIGIWIVSHVVGIYLILVV